LVAVVVDDDDGVLGVGRRAGIAAAMHARSEHCGEVLGRRQERIMYTRV
jgi:hypothetical protein